MESTRFSMKEFRPQQMDEKIIGLEIQRNEIDEKRTELVDRKKQIELTLSEINNKIRGHRFESSEYDSILDEQNKIKQEKYAIEKQIISYKGQIRDINQTIDSYKRRSRQIPISEIKETVIEMRDKYLSFSADTTRVSSMRAMSSKFVEELTSIINKLP